MIMKYSLPVLFITLTLFNTACQDNEPEQRSYEEQLAIDVGIIDDYLAEQNIDATVDPSGLRYVINEPGQGASASINDNITVGYVGKFLENGEVFDQNESVEFPLARLIEAWQIAIPLIQEGGSMTVYAPSGLCYGAATRSGIPANANMIFDLNLIRVE
jgi:FKBP-type peptidyl-prolyl cis-trans isomerase